MKISNLIILGGGAVLAFALWQKSRVTPSTEPAPQQEPPEPFYGPVQQPMPPILGTLGENVLPTVFPWGIGDTYFFSTISGNWGTIDTWRNEMAFGRKINLISSPEKYRAGLVAPPWQKEPSQMVVNTPSAIYALTPSGQIAGSGYNTGWADNPTLYG